MSAGETPARALFTPRAVLWMVLAGVFAFCAFLSLSAYAPDFRGHGDPGAHALSRSAVGYAGMVELLRAQGQPVVISRTDRPAAGLLILTPPPTVKADAFERIVQSGSLTVLPKWRAAPHPLNAEWVRKIGPFEQAELDKALKAVGAAGATLSRRDGAAAVVLHGAPGSPFQGKTLATGPIDRLQTIQGDGLIPILVDDQGRTVLAQVGEEEDARYLLAEPDLLNTQGLRALTSARAAVGLLDGLRRPGEGVAFDVTLNGFARSRSLLKLALQPPFLSATLCLAFAALLMGLHAAARFGRVATPPRALALGKTALADNSAGLIRLARREPQMAARYVELTRAATARAVGSADLSGDALDAALDRQAAAAGVAGRITDFARRARAVGTVAELLALAGELHHWRSEMTRERR